MWNAASIGTTGWKPIDYRYHEGGNETVLEAIAFLRTRTIMQHDRTAIILTNRGEQEMPKTVPFWFHVTTNLWGHHPVRLKRPHFAKTTMDTNSRNAEEKTKSLLKLFKKVGSLRILDGAEGSSAGGRNAVHFSGGGKRDSAGGKGSDTEAREAVEGAQGAGGVSSPGLEEGKEGYARDLDGATAGRVREEQGNSREGPRHHAHDGRVLP